MAPKSAGTATRTPAGDVRRLLLAAALRVLDEHGEKGLTIRAVATAAQVAPMGVYNRFDGKAGLMTALVTEGFARLQVMVASAVDVDSNKRLLHSGMAYREFAFRSPTLYRLMFSGQYKPDGDIANSALGALTEIIRYGQAAGTIRAGDPFDLTLQVWACVHGAVSLELDNSGPEGTDEHWAFIYQQTIDLIIRGVAPDS